MGQRIFPKVRIWGFPKIRGTFLGVPIIRTIVFWSLYWGTLILGNYHLWSLEGMPSSSLNIVEGFLVGLKAARLNPGRHGVAMTSAQQTRQDAQGDVDLAPC